MSWLRRVVNSKSLVSVLAGNRTLAGEAPDGSFLPLACFLWEGFTQWAQHSLAFLLNVTCSAFGEGKAS